jgi:hypothetical protein
VTVYDVPGITAMLFFHPNPPPPPPWFLSDQELPPPPPPTQTAETEYTPKGAVQVKVPGVINVDCPIDVTQKSDW